MLMIQLVPQIRYFGIQQWTCTPLGNHIFHLELTDLECDLSRSSSLQYMSSLKNA